MSGTTSNARWTKDKIISQIRDLKAQDQDLSYNCVSQDQQGLLSAANYHFGSWKSAVEAAGINYDRDVRRIPKWTKERIVEAIRTARGAGEDLSWTNISKHREWAGMAYAAIRASRFGGWDEALSAAGVSPSDVRRYEAWTDEKILDRIKARQQAGKALNSKAMQQEDCKLFNAALKRYEGWAEALRVAGIKPDDVYKRHRWSKDRIRKIIRQLNATGEDLAAPAMRKIHPALYSAACKYFGSWTTARRACGITRNFRRKKRA